MTICGFLRLRIPRLSTIPDENPGEDGIFPELQGCALVREVHVYGTLIPTTDGSNSAAQHVGFGRRMLEEAEAIARRHSLYKMAVISGVGARNYYKKFGYELVKAGTTKDGIKAHGDFQIKHISQSSNSRDNRFESKDQQQRREASHLKINDSASAKYSLATKVALAVAILLVLAFMRRKA